MPYRRPKKRFSQNFLSDNNIAAEIVGLLDIRPDDTVFEIGTGRGILTGLIAEKNVELFSFELDSELYEDIKPSFSEYEKVKIVNTDFLKVKPADYCEGYFKLIGNIPYDITSPLISWIIKHHDVIDRAVIMTQKELAERISSSPGTKDWAPIAIFSQCYFDIKCSFTVPPTVFVPRPRVKSAVMLFEPSNKFSLVHPQLFHNVVRNAFRHRRKKMIGNLVQLLDIEKTLMEEMFQKLDLDFNIRAEQLTIGQFIELTEEISSLNNS